MKVQLLSEKDQFLYGVRKGENENTYSLTYGNLPTGQLYMTRFRSDYCTNPNSVLLESIWLAQVFKQAKNEFYINGQLAYTHSYTNFEAGGGDKRNLYLFNVNTNGSFSNSMGADLKFYYCKIWDGSTLIRDFIPVINNKDKICLYDKVEQKLYNAKYVAKQEEFERNSEKTELKSIACDGNQYVDTEIKPNQDTIVEMKCKIATDAGDQALFGSRTSVFNSTFTTFFVNNNTIRCDYNTTQTNIGAIDRDKERMIKQNKNIFYLDGVQKGNTNYSNFNSAHNLYLFAVNTMGTEQLKSKLEFYYCKIWDGNTLVRDFVPIMDENRDIYLYDKVNSKKYVSKDQIFQLGGKISKP